MSSSNVAGSRWGFRRSENLGGGQSALFMLENGSRIGIGTASQSGRLFGRQAWAGIKGDWGELSLSRQMNALYDLFPPFDSLRYMGDWLLTLDS